MSLLPSLFESRRSRLPGIYRESAFSDLEKLMDELMQAAPLVGNGGSGFPMDVEELEDRYLVTAELPGVEKEDCTITLQDRLLTIEVKRQELSEQVDQYFLRRERRTGSAVRSITLPHAAGEESVEASLKEGVLRISIKKDQAEKARRIKVS